MLFVWTLTFWVAAPAIPVWLLLPPFLQQPGVVATLILIVASSLFCALLMYWLIKWYAICIFVFSGNYRLADIEISRIERQLDKLS